MDKPNNGLTEVGALLAMLTPCGVDGTFLLCKECTASLKTAEQALTDWIDKEIIGQDEELPSPHGEDRDFLRHQFTIIRHKNQLRQQQRNKLRESFRG